MEAVRQNKVFLIDILSADASIVLQFVQNESIITRRDYNKLNHPNHTPEMIIINLLDTVTNKGKETCEKFLKLLEKEEFQENFPQLKKLFTPDRTPREETSRDSKDPPKPPSEDNEYKMSSKPRGICLIINNMEFNPPLGNRKGSDKDEESLMKVFTFLGFTVKVHRDQTAEEMKAILKTLSKTKHEGDCFVCCILSHGSTDGVCGVDGGVVQGSDIYDQFNGTSCHSLINKPKVFFIQACRGEQYQQLVKVQADGYMEAKAGMEKEKEDLETDAVLITIPAEADFLVAKSTVKGFYSFRSNYGSWFIQSLCEQLNKYCPMGEDVYSILLRVNEDVSKKVGIHSDCRVKQMPVQKITLRKKLVFRVPQ